MCCRPELCTLIGWIETSCLCLSFSKVSLGQQPKTFALSLVDTEEQPSLFQNVELFFRGTICLTLENLLGTVNIETFIYFEVLCLFLA